MRTIFGLENANSYRDKYQPESSTKCYFNPDNLSQVSLRCRDTIFPMNCIIGCTILPIGLLLFLMVPLIVGRIVDKFLSPDESDMPDCCTNKHKPCFSNHEKGGKEQARQDRDKAQVQNKGKTASKAQEHFFGHRYCFKKFPHARLCGESSQYNGAMRCCACYHRTHSIEMIVGTPRENGAIGSKF